MKLFGKCMLHNWEHVEIYYDCSDVCIWSSGTVYYRRCKDCHRLETASYWNKKYTLTTEKEDIREFENFKNEKKTRKSNGN